MNATQILDKYRYEIEVNGVNHKVIVLNEIRCLELLTKSRDMETNYKKLKEVKARLYNDFNIKKVILDDVIKELSREELIRIFFDRKELEDVLKARNIYQFNGDMYEIIRKENTHE